MNAVHVDNDNLTRCLQALLGGDELVVTTRTRDFRGQVVEIRRSPYIEHYGVTAVDSEGRVHNFFPTKADCRVEYFSS